MLALCMAALLPGCGESKPAETRKTGQAIMGQMGDTLNTVFFSFRVEEAYLASEYAGCPAAEGSEFVVLTLALNNLQNGAIPLFDTDFQLQWGDNENAQAYSFPAEKRADEQLCGSYTLQKGESKTGTLVFEAPAEAVPAGSTGYSLVYMETYSDGFQGNSYWVYFVPSQKK